MTKNYAEVALDILPKLAELEKPVGKTCSEGIQQLET
jgi:hypothetical protein